jgi:hypothetical protein
MNIKEQMGTVGYLDSAAIVNAVLLKSFQFRKEGGQVDDDSVANEASCGGVQNAGGQQVEREFFAIDPNCVSCIG